MTSEANTSEAGYDLDALPAAAGIWHSVTVTGVWAVKSTGTSSGQRWTVSIYNDGRHQRPPAHAYRHAAWNVTTTFDITPAHHGFTGIAP